MKVAIIQLLCRIRDWGRYLFFRWNALCHRVVPCRGITIVGTLSDNASLSKVMRDFAFSLHNAGIPFQTYDLTRKPSSIPLREIAGILTPRRNFRATRYTHVVELASRAIFPKFKGIKRTVIAFWETTRGLMEINREILDNVDILIAMSDFNASYFNSLAIQRNKKAIKVLYPLHIPDITTDDVVSLRQRYNLATDDFVVFFNFDLMSSERKNPDGVLKAFGKAFPNEKNVRLVLKTMHAGRLPEKLENLYKLAEELHISNRFSTINSYIPQKDLYGLVKACDVYMSLHRGEGFGLGIAEAMSMGKPVIVTNWSSTTEFCNSSNSIPIPFRMIPPEPDDRLYSFLKGTCIWADADIDAAAGALRRLYENQTLRDELGQKARQFIIEHFSLDNFRTSVEKLLDS